MQFKLVVVNNSNQLKWARVNLLCQINAKELAMVNLPLLIWISYYYWLPPVWSKIYHTEDCVLLGINAPSHKVASELIVNGTQFECDKLLKSWFTRWIDEGQYHKRNVKILSSVQIWMGLAQKAHFSAGSHTVWMYLFGLLANFNLMENAFKIGKSVWNFLSLLSGYLSVCMQKD